MALLSPEAREVSVIGTAIVALPAKIHRTSPGSGLMRLCLIGEKHDSKISVARTTSVVESTEVMNEESPRLFVIEDLLFYLIRFPSDSVFQGSYPALYAAFECQKCIPFNFICTNESADQ